MNKTSKKESSKASRVVSGMSKLKFEEKKDPNVEEDEVIGTKTLAFNSVGNPDNHNKEQFGKYSRISLTLLLCFLEEKKVEPEVENDKDKKKKKAGKKITKLNDDGSFNTYIFRVLKEVSPETGISKRAMMTLNQMIAHKFDEIMCEARDLASHTKKQTIGSREVESAIKLHFPGELGKLAVT